MRTEKDDLLGWAVCANISDHLRAGREPDKFYQGTKVFSPKTKVYLGQAYWGTAGERLHVIGLGRKSRNWVNCAVHIGTLNNLRVASIYSPSVWTKLDRLGAFAADTKEDADIELRRYVRAWEDERPDKLKKGSK